MGRAWPFHSTFQQTEPTQTSKSKAMNVLTALEISLCWRSAAARLDRIQVRVVVICCWLQFKNFQPKRKKDEEIHCLMGAREWTTIWSWNLKGIYTNPRADGCNIPECYLTHHNCCCFLCSFGCAPNLSDYSAVTNNSPWKWIIESE